MKRRSSTSSSKPGLLREEADLDLVVGLQREHDLVRDVLATARTGTSWDGGRSRRCACTPHPSTCLTPSSRGTPAHRGPVKPRAQLEVGLCVAESGDTPGISRKPSTCARNVSSATSPGVIGTQRLDERGPRIADVVGLMRLGLLHRDEREHLQQVVLPDVAQRADAVVERSALLGADLLEQRDVDRLDGLAAPLGSRTGCW